MSTAPAVSTSDLCYRYPDSSRGLNDLNLEVLCGQKFLIVGPNGAGKSTLLKVLAGQKLIKSGSIKIYGINPFDLRQKYTQKVIYLGTEWANNEIIKRDINVLTLVQSIGGDNFPERRDQLIKLLDIDTRWRMNRCSDGQRRRVQLLMGLVNPWDLLLLDEVTIDLDVLVRQRLLSFLDAECSQRNATVIYATHIFDGMGHWPDKVLHLVDGSIDETFLQEDISYDNGSEVVRHGQGKVTLPKTDSLHPLAINWLLNDPNE